MPFKSKAQRRLFWAKANKGEIPVKTVKEWEAHTKNKKLPEHVKESSYSLGREQALASLGPPDGGVVHR